MQRIFFIGDIHGCSKTFKNLVTEKIGLKRTDQIYCVGDYIDRGNDSKGVVDFILELKYQGFRIHTVRGNHEQMLLDSESGKDAYYHWMINGGSATLASFNIHSVAELEPVYMKFFRSTEYFFRTKDFIVVHAGLNFSADDPLSDYRSMLWIRESKADRSYLGRRLLIHGHTARERKFIISQKSGNKLNLDGGCVYKENKGMGSLFAYNFIEREFIEVQNID